MYQDLVDSYYVGMPVYYQHPTQGGRKHYGVIHKVEPFIRGRRIHIKFDGIDTPLLYTVTYDVCMIWAVDEIPTDPSWEV